MVPLLFIFFLISILLSSYFSHWQDSVLSFIHKFWYLGCICSVDWATFFLLIISTMTLPGTCTQKLLLQATEKVWGTPFKKHHQLENQNMWEGNRRAQQIPAGKRESLTVLQHGCKETPQTGTTEVSFQMGAWMTQSCAAGGCGDARDQTCSLLTLTLLIQTRDYKELNFCCF